MIIGGLFHGNPTEEVESVDLNTNKVSLMPSMNKKRYSHSCVSMVLEGIQVIVAAGKKCCCIS